MRCNFVNKNKRKINEIVTKMASKKTIFGGFSAVKTNPEYHRDSTKEKGQKLVESGHVFDVKEVRENDSIEIIGFCVKETSIRDHPYRIVLSLDQQRIVQDSRCQCISGQNGDCKHTAALIYFVNSERQESQTDQQCQWRKPSQYGQKLYSKGKTFDEIFNLSQPKCSFKPPSKSEQDSHLELLKKHGDSGSMMFQMLTAKVRGRKGWILPIFSYFDWLFSGQRCC